MHSEKMIVESTPHRSRAVLTKEKACEIFCQKGLIYYGPNGKFVQNSSKFLALEYGVSPKTIRDIWNGRTWSHVTGTLMPAIIERGSSQYPPQCRAPSARHYGQPRVFHDSKHRRPKLPPVLPTNPQTTTVRLLLHQPTEIKWSRLPFPPRHRPLHSETPWIQPTGTRPRDPAAQSTQRTEESQQQTGRERRPGDAQHEQEEPASPCQCLPHMEEEEAEDLLLLLPPEQCTVKDEEADGGPAAPPAAAGAGFPVIHGGGGLQWYAEEDTDTPGPGWSPHGAASDPDGAASSYGSGARASEPPEPGCGDGLPAAAPPPTERPPCGEGRAPTPAPAHARGLAAEATAGGDSDGAAPDYGFLNDGGYGDGGGYDGCGGGSSSFAAVADEAAAAAAEFGDPFHDDWAHWE